MEFMDLIEIPRVDNVKLTRQVFNVKLNQAVVETLDCAICLTSHHCIFSPTKPKSMPAPSAANENGNKSSQEIWILHSLIDAVEQKIRENKLQLVLKLKNFQILHVDLPTAYCCQSIGKSLDALSNLTSDNMKFPFFNTAPVCEQQFRAYSPVDDFAELARRNPTDAFGWRLSDVNANYAVCSTYPTKVIVPKSIDDATLVKSSQFRAGGRFPILSYYHSKTGSFLMRSSQPLLGTHSRRCKEDECLLKSALPMGKKGFVYDLRDAAALKQAAARGGGYETDASYPLWKRINRHLERPAELHVSLGRLADACCGAESAQSVDRHLARVESSGWLLAVRQALHVACCIGDELHNKHGCVLTHGWDGTDNTALVCSLVQLVLAAESRTLRGFQRLVDKEWLQAGHPFARRCFKSAYGATAARHEAPVFLLFLDCVRQLVEQFCLSFEFNEQLLLLLADHAYASEYGTFLANSEKEREQLQVATRTASLWSFVNSPDTLKSIVNPLYEANNSPLFPSLFPQALSLWNGLFLRYQRNENTFREARAESVRLVEANRQAKLKVERLKNELLQLRQEATQRGIKVE